MLRDDGPPVSPETLRDARESLPVEYGHKVVSEQDRRVLLVRSPLAKPDYLNELAKVGLYVSLEEAREVKDVILIGEEKICRVEPVRLRDHIREHDEKGAALVEDVRRYVPRDYGVTTRPSPHAEGARVVIVRIPRRSVNEITPEDVTHTRSAVADVPDARDAHAAYLVGDNDHARLNASAYRDLVQAPGDAAPADPTPPASNGVADLKSAALAGAGQGNGSTPPTPVVAADAAPAANAAPEEPAEAPQQDMRAVVNDTDVEVYVRESREAPAAAPAPEPEPQPEPPVPEAAPPATNGDTPDGGHGMAPVHQDDEYEVYVRDAAPAPAPETPPEAPPAPAFEPPAEPERTLPPTGNGATGYGDGPAPSRLSEIVEETEEYEVIVTKKPDHVDLPETPAAAESPAPVAEPAPARREPADTADALPGTRHVPGPSGDNGTVVEPSVVAAVDAVATLSGKLQDAGYEAMEDVDVMGHTFDLAAHKLEGKRILVKRYDHVSSAEVEEMKRVANDLGADVCVLVASDTAPGVHLAAWGSRVVIVSPEEAARLKP